MHDESIYAERALRAGANGYIMKQEATEKVLVALRRILGGEIYVSDRIANKMLKHYITGSGTLQTFLDRRSERSGTGSLSSDRRRSRNPADRRRVAPQREDGRILPGAHQGKIISAQCARTHAARHSVEHERKDCVRGIFMPVGSLDRVARMPLVGFGCISSSETSRLTAIYLRYQGNPDRKNSGSHRN